MRGRCRETETRGAEGAEEGGGEHFSPLPRVPLGDGQEVLVLRRRGAWDAGGRGSHKLTARLGIQRLSVDWPAANRPGFPLSADSDLEGSLMSGQLTPPSPISRTFFFPSSPSSELPPFQQRSSRFCSPTSPTISSFQSARLSSNPAVECLRLARPSPS